VLYNIYQDYLLEYLVPAIGQKARM